MSQAVEKMVSVIVPVFNEEGNIALLHQRLLSVLKKLNQNYEIIIDDGSTDGTLNQLRQACKEDPSTNPTQW